MMMLISMEERVVGGGWWMLLSDINHGANIMDSLSGVSTESRGIPHRLEGEANDNLTRDWSPPVTN